MSSKGYTQPASSESVLVKESRISPVHSKALIFSKERGRNGVYFAVSTILCVVYLMLPIERGFPVIRIAGYPVTLSIITSTGAIMIIWIESHGKVLNRIVDGYVVTQFTVVWFFLVSSLMSEDVEADLFVVLNYFVIFVLNFLILTYLFRQGFRKHFIVILCTVACFVAAMGILEGVFRYYLPFYRDLFLNYDFARMEYAMNRPDFRALGMLGNPILYSVALTMCVPFAMELRSKLGRILVISLFLWSSYYAISSSALLVVLFLSIGFLIVYQKKKITLVGVFILVALILVVIMGAELVDSQWFDEFAVDNINIQIRLDIWRWAIEHFAGHKEGLIILFGEGLKASVQSVPEYMGTMMTLDNTYINLLLNSGILGLVSYLFMTFMLICRFRSKAFTSLHWYNLIGMLALGMSFETPFYASFNFVWVASVAAMASSPHSVLRSRNVNG